MKQTADAAVAESPSVEPVLVVRRVGDAAGTKDTWKHGTRRWIGQRWWTGQSPVFTTAHDRAPKTPTC